MVTLFLEEFVDAAVIFGVVLVNAIIGFIQESKALRAIESLAHTLVTEATVIRNGKKTRINSADVVPGDIILLQSGDKVPADGRILRCRDLQVAEAALTGESVPVQKQEAELPEETPLADRKNMVYGSTLVTFGSATAVVVATGDRTEVGRISELIAKAEEIQTPLTRRIAQFSKVLLVIILGLAAANFAIGLARPLFDNGLDNLNWEVFWKIIEPKFAEMFLASVALAVAAIPEGLPAAVTITLAIGVARMARRRAIIRKLPAVETLGSTTVICSDKTGTLTENQMTVTTLVAGDEIFEVTGTGYSPAGEIRPLGQSREETTEAGDGQPPAKLTVTDFHRRVALLETIRAGALCNDSQLVKTEDGWTIQGDPTEGAMLVVAAKAGFGAEILREELPRIDSIPFESEHQYMATLHDQGADRPRIAYAKGSVEAILKRCSYAWDNVGELKPLDVDAILAQADQLAAKGLRVLALALKEFPHEHATLSHDDVSEGMIFLGLQAMIDPPRQEAITAIRTCRSAGIQVKMITGDHALTAAAIASQLGIGGENVEDLSKIKVCTGQQLSQISDDDLVDMVEETSVYARVAPEQKLRLVKALQARSHVVAMTGDGVNDAPALKQADIGVAMGKTGTDVAREAADMVLTDDNFATIEAAVEEGRGIFDNLTKFIVWTLPTNVGEGMVILAAVVVGTSLPIAPVQILWINMTTAVLLGLMLAFEPKESGIMSRPPRDPNAPILGRSLIMRIGLVSLLLLIGSFGLFKWYYTFKQADLAEAQTLASNAFVIGEMFYLFNCRSLTRSMFRIGLFSNPAVIYGSLGMLALQLLFTYAPPMNLMFHTAPVGWDTWLVLAGFGLAVYVIVEIEKRLVGHVLQGQAFHPKPKNKVNAK
ncbi:MAG: HAD-IC family P-type ATPase [Gemmatales bacterium]|nr:HAD-IC family P-type ATPase [Gemmatales bacterium]